MRILGLLVGQHLLQSDVAHEHGLDGHHLGHAQLRLLQLLVLRLSSHHHLH